MLIIVKFIAHFSFELNLNLNSNYDCFGSKFEQNV